MSLKELSLASPRVLPSYSYGTSGFRGVATTLDSIAVRMGALAVGRSIVVGREREEKQKKEGKINTNDYPAVGCVITASHNDAPDNGIKLIDYNGEMLHSNWEEEATLIANAKEEDVPQVLQNIIQKYLKQAGIDYSTSTSSSSSSPSPSPVVFVSRDTRRSSPHLSSLLISSAKSLGAKVIDYGLSSTPLLHWVVRAANEGRSAKKEDYYDEIVDGFKSALSCKLNNNQTNASSTPLLSPLILDCADGVGALCMSEFSSRLRDFLPVEMRNTTGLEGDGLGLNNKCGAEHVQKNKTLPRNFDQIEDKNKKMASLDGDADRLVYFTIDSTTNKFRLLDGDKTIALYTLFIRDLLTQSDLSSHLRIGIVQTAYANGASTIYMQHTLGIPVHFTNTGVKHLHHKAVEFDIGIYFESNGHGTVVFSKKAKELIKKTVDEKEGSSEKKHCGYI
jgi:phosphoacetylglucosamine mutase